MHLRLARCLQPRKTSIPAGKEAHFCVWSPCSRIEARRVRCKVVRPTTCAKNACILPTSTIRAKAGSWYCQQEGSRCTAVVPRRRCLADNKATVVLTHATTACRTTCRNRQPFRTTHARTRTDASHTGRLATTCHTR
jgi:hypothetical protein